jgi:hypothetical protein
MAIPSTGSLPFVFVVVVIALPASDDAMRPLDDDADAGADADLDGTTTASFASFLLFVPPTTATTAFPPAFLTRDDDFLFDAAMTDGWMDGVPLV